MSYKDEVLKKSINLIKSFENEWLYRDEKDGKNNSENLKIHKDSAGNIAIGYGLDLIVHSESELKNIFDKANQWSSDKFDYDSLRPFNKIQEYKKLSRDYQKESFITENQNLRLPSIEYANTLFNLVAEDKFKAVKKIANAKTDKDYYSKLTKAEKSTIFSMAYNSGYGLFFGKTKQGKRKVIDFNKPYNCVKKLREYLDNKESNPEQALKARTRVWYEFRYNSCLEAWQNLSGGRGLAKRRYSEGDLFGLYDEDVKSEEAEWILDKLKDESIQKQGIKSIEKIACYFEKNIVAPSEVGEYRRVNDKVKGIKEIIKDLENKAAQDPVKQIKAEVKEKGRKIDNVSEEFLKKYDEKYGLVLDKKKPIYNSIIKIEKNQDVLIFPLMDRLVVSMEKEKEKAKDEDKKYKAIHQLINRCKKTLEEVIDELGGYVKTKYKQDNNKNLADLKLKKRLIANFKPKQFNTPDTKKSHKFFKSFITKEDRKKERAKKEAEEKKKSKEEREKRAKKEKAKRKREAKVAERQRKEERERTKKREGWIIVSANGEHKLMSRKEYYGV
ncbi:hypothetical protein JCM16358_23770 [Halanaerocella petrolearia]